MRKGPGEGSGGPPETEDELHFANVLKSRERLSLPMGMHPCLLYEGSTPRGTMDIDGPEMQTDHKVATAIERKLPEAMELLVERRFQDLFELWRKPDRKMADMDDEELLTSSKESRDDINSSKELQAQMPYAYETIFAEVLRRSGLFNNVLMTNDETDMLRHADILLRFDYRDHRNRLAKEWHSVDLTTTQNRNKILDKDGLDGGSLLPLISKNQDPSVGLAPEKDSRLEIGRKVAFIDSFVFKWLIKRLKVIAEKKRLCELPEVWFLDESGPNPIWTLSTSEDDYFFPGTITWEPETVPEEISDEKFLSLFYKSLAAGRSDREMAEASREVTVAPAEALERWPTDGREYLDRLANFSSLSRNPEIYK